MEGKSSINQGTVLPTVTKGYALEGRVNIEWICLKMPDQLQKS